MSRESSGVELKAWEALSRPWHEADFKTKSTDPHRHKMRSITFGRITGVGGSQNQQGSWRSGKPYKLQAWQGPVGKCFYDEFVKDLLQDTPRRVCSCNGCDPGRIQTGRDWLDEGDSGS